MVKIKTTTERKRQPPHLMRYIGKPFKTFAGALKRAQFENAHQQHLTRRYVHRVEKIGDTYRVVRERKETRVVPLDSGS